MAQKERRINVFPCTSETFGAVNFSFFALALLLFFSCSFCLAFQVQVNNLLAPNPGKINE